MASLCFTMLILLVATIARTEPIPRLLDLPQVYLPGSSPPEDMICAPVDGVPSCFAEFRDLRVFFLLDFDERKIVAAVVPVPDYVLGQLIVSWGTPTGIQWNQHTVYVNWSTHWAIIDSASLRPDSRVHLVQYAPKQPAASPWRGFRR
jgi:hypothetical protein